MLLVYPIFADGFNVLKRRNTDVLDGSGVQCYLYFILILLELIWFLLNKISFEGICGCNTFFSSSCLNSSQLVSQSGFLSTSPTVEKLTISFRMVCKVHQRQKAANGDIL